jgi:hypothetical protein
MLTEPQCGWVVQVARVAHFLGKRIEYVNEAEVYEPRTQLVMRSIKGPFPIRITYSFDDGWLENGTAGDEAGAGTLARIRVEGYARGFYRMAGPLLNTMVQRSIGRDIANLKKVLELTR